MGTSGGTRQEPGMRTVGRYGTVHGAVTTCYRVYTGLIPGSHRLLNVDPPSHTGYLLVPYRSLNVEPVS